MQSTGLPASCWGMLETGRRTIRSLRCLLSWRAMVSASIFNFGRLCLTNYSNCPESITYFTLMAGICRSGMTAFPISPRNSPAAIAHLLAKTEASHIFVGPESALQNLAASALGHLDASGTTLPASCHVPTFAELYPNTPEDNFELLPPLNVSWDDPTIIVHSSGETA